VRERDEVVFKEFDGDVTAEGAGQVFRFTASNYEVVCREIAELAKAQRKRDTPR
jgi:hypothetical protein